MKQIKVKLSHLSKIFNQTELAELLKTKQPNIAKALKESPSRVIIIDADNIGDHVLKSIRSMALFYNKQAGFSDDVRSAIMSASSIRMERIKRKRG